MSLNTRLDAADSVFFRRQLESIDSRVYQTKYPQYKSRGLIPTQQGVDPDARVYTYRMMNQVGKAKFIANGADDLPTSDATGAEYSQVIRELGASYKYDLSEIRAAAKSGTQLDDMRAMAARRAIEEKIDNVLAMGDDSLGLKGLLRLSGTSTVTAASGSWGTLASPGATADEMAADLLGLGSKGASATDEAFNRFVIVMPLIKYQQAAQTKMSTYSDITVLKYVQMTSPYIEDIVPWFRTELAGGSLDTTRACAFPRDAECVSALVPRELEFLTPEQRNLCYVINGVASCGGVVVRHPLAITYLDGI